MLIVILFIVFWVVTPCFLVGTYKLLEEFLDPIFTSKLKVKAAHFSGLVTLSVAKVSCLIGTAVLSPEANRPGLEDEKSAI
jgi:hypothetical protein